MTVENINFHFPLGAKISEEETVAILVEKVKLISNKEFEFPIDVIKMGGQDFGTASLLLLNKEEIPSFLTTTILKL